MASRRERSSLMPDAFDFSSTSPDQCDQDFCYSEISGLRVWCIIALKYSFHLDLIDPLAGVSEKAMISYSRTKPTLNVRGSHGYATTPSNVMWKALAAHYDYARSIPRQAQFPVLMLRYQCVFSHECLWLVHVGIHRAAPVYNYLTQNMCMSLKWACFVGG
ncbi:hypothetical protein K439DRAFT_1617360 [Ramaria rubella]|nr:hypothetical protein K439DRAFT_1617360 [Ramaria rubella]